MSGNSNGNTDDNGHRDHHDHGHRDHHDHGGDENVFSKRVRAGKRTYFFDVKATKSAKDYYLVITESRRVAEEKYEKHKLFLYKEDFSKFAEALAETTRHIENDLLEKAEGAGERMP
jgi:hypothetical protein